MSGRAHAQEQSLVEPAVPTPAVGWARGPGGDEPVVLGDLQLFDHPAPRQRRGRSLRGFAPQLQRRGMDLRHANAAVFHIRRDAWLPVRADDVRPEERRHVVGTFGGVVLAVGAHGRDCTCALLVLRGRAQEREQVRLHDLRRMPRPRRGSRHRSRRGTRATSSAEPMPCFAPGTAPTHGIVGRTMRAPVDPSTAIADSSAAAYARCPLFCSGHEIRLRVGRSHVEQIPHAPEGGRPCQGAVGPPSRSSPCARSSRA